LFVDLENQIVSWLSVECIWKQTY